MRMNAYVAGVGMVGFGKHLDRTLKGLAAEAVQLALNDAGMDKSMLQAAWMGNAAAGVVTGQEMIRGEVALRSIGIGRIPVVNVENACASSSTAFQQASAMVSAGLYDVVLACGSEKLFHEDKARSLGAFSSAVDIEDPHGAVNVVRRIAEEIGEPFDAATAGVGRSIFMDIYAVMAKKHMKKYGSTKAHFAMVAAKNSLHGSMNPRAQFQEVMTVELYEFYGAAEGGLTVNPPGAGPVGSIGKPVANLDCRIVDDDGRDAERDASGERTGELLFRAKDGTPFKLEYHGNPKASAEKCAGGWLHMGDVVREDGDGWLYFLYRKGAGIRRNGDFINTAFIEKVIAEVPAVDDVYVYGIPAANGVPGEKDVVAAVVPKDAGHATFDVQGLYRVCRQALEANFVPSYIQVLSQIPKTASEKPQDRFLIESLATNPGAVHSEVR